MAEEKWIDLRTAPKEQVQLSLEYQFQLGIKNLIQVRREFESYNENRFADNPMQMRFSFDFDEVWAKFNQLPIEKQNAFLAESFED